jgi:hypothetical protein
MFGIDFTGQKPVYSLGFSLQNGIDFDLIGSLLVELCPKYCPKLVQICNTENQYVQKDLPFKMINSSLNLGRYYAIVLSTNRHNIDLIGSLLVELCPKYCPKFGQN